jgi:NAD(P)-dependent dehydrogenase (short-subunit alcohol dehydrogenase family)
VHAIDVLPTPSSEFQALQAEDPKSLHYHNLDVRDEAILHSTVKQIADKHNRLDGHIAAAGILAEIDAFDYTAADFRKYLDVNVTGVFLTSQACAKQMARLGNRGGSIVLIASMSGTISNKVFSLSSFSRSYD